MIISERPNNPAYFDKISDLLNQLLQAQKEGKMQYKELIEQLIEKIREVRSDTKLKYPKAIDTKGKRALYDNLGRDEALAVMVHNAVKQNARDGFRDTSGGGMKMKALRQAVKRVLPDVSVDKLDEIMQIIIAQSEY